MLMVAWYLNGKLHRDNWPAIERVNGDLNDKLHREDGPAVEYTDGRKEWYLNGKEHTEDNFLHAMENNYTCT